MSLGNPAYMPNRDDSGGSGHGGFQIHTGDPEPPKRQTALWLAFILLAVVLFFAIQQGRVTLDGQNAQLAQLQPLSDAYTGVRDLLTATKNEITMWAAETEGLRSRLGKMERAVSENAKLTKNFVHEMVAEMAAQIRAESDARLQAVDERLQTIEAQQSAQAARLTGVESQVHQELALLRKDTQQGLGKLATQVDGNGRHVELLDARTNVERLDFQLPKGRQVDLLPGISAQITKVRVDQQQFDAQISLWEERHTLQVEKSSAYQPLRFYSKRQSQAFEMVVTDVSKDFVLGYLLVPARAAEMRTELTPPSRTAEKRNAGSN